MFGYAMHLVAGHRAAVAADEGGSGACFGGKILDTEGSGVEGCGTSR
jgi:hypothetical protein